MLNQLGTHEINNQGGYVIIFEKNVNDNNYGIRKFYKKGMGIGDGDWGLGSIPNPQSPIPNPQSVGLKILFLFNNIYYS